MSPFVDRIWVDGVEYEDDLDTEMKSALDKLGAGQVGSVVLGRTKDRDAYMEIERTGNLFLVRGSEDSVERGTFGYCMYWSEEPDGFVDTREGPFPLYGTTKSFQYVQEVARVYFQYGDVPRKSNWLVAADGLGVARDKIRPESVVGTGDNRPLEAFVRPGV